MSIDDRQSAAALPEFVYSESYDMDLGPHVFPSVKFGQIYKKLQSDSRFKKHTFTSPELASYDEARLVHDRSYLKDLMKLKMTKSTYKSEIPLTKFIVDAFFLATGGTILSARLALKHGSSFNLTGGFHHAFGDHAEGFCYLNDTAIAIRLLQKEKAIKRALIIDLDVHQGNGSARIFQKDDSVFTFSIHEANNYPMKENGSLDIGLQTGCKDDEYLTLLGEALEKIKNSFSPNLIFYLAGVDPFENDRLGGLALTKKGLAERDRIVRDFLPEVPLAAVLAGGYAVNTDDTVDLHVQTCEVMAGFK